MNSGGGAHHPPAARVGVNMMFGIWTVGAACDPEGLLERLAASTFSVIVLMVALAVAAEDIIYVYLRDLVDISNNRHTTATEPNTLFSSRIIPCHGLVTP